uniref:Uncharacterized protein n=1 Tax=Anguilla anguilla TaxID=7936 RepID=A0A0E9RKT5_ANGAN
MDMQADRQIGR